MENMDEGELGQYIEEMHRMMNKASRRIAFLIEYEYSREEQVDCLKCCIELLQGESYEEYVERGRKVLELIAKETKKF